jgi:predicted dinucleotide-binding enzyme
LRIRQRLVASCAIAAGRAATHVAVCKEPHMRIGFIGAGHVGVTIARHFIKAGHQVVLSNSRGPESLRDAVSDLGPSAKAGTREEAVQSDLVVLCVHWSDAREALRGIEWGGRILVDATNAHLDVPADVSLAGVTRSRAALAKTGRTSSELIAEWAPGARVVKSISNIPMAWIDDFSESKPKTVIFTSGDDSEAKRLVMDLLTGAGFAPVDLGSLREGGALHQVGAPLSGLELHLARRLR